MERIITVQYCLIMLRGPQRPDMPSDLPDTAHGNLRTLLLPLDKGKKKGSMISAPSIIQCVIP
jgi:hypothetical protein